MYDAEYERQKREEKEAAYLATVECDKRARYGLKLCEDDRRVTSSSDDDDYSAQTIDRFGGTGNGTFQPVIGTNCGMPRCSGISKGSGVAGPHQPQSVGSAL